MKNEKGIKLCEHMERLVNLAVENNVEWGGCGDCGSPWLICHTCDLSIDDCNIDDISDIANRPEWAEPFEVRWTRANGPSN